MHPLPVTESWLLPKDGRSVAELRLPGESQCANGARSARNALQAPILF